MTIAEIIDKNKKLGYDTKWEIACFYADNTQVPIEIYEYAMEETRTFFTRLGLITINEEFDFLEISLIAQDEDGNNEICDMLKTIQITKECKDDED
jgi:L-ribulose-5-phosphate 3-epimerase UlaE